LEGLSPAATMARFEVVSDEGAYPSHRLPVLVQRAQFGLASSHLTRRILRQCQLAPLRRTLLGHSYYATRYSLASYASAPNFWRIPSLCHSLFSHIRSCRLTEDHSSAARFLEGPSSPGLRAASCMLVYEAAKQAAGWFRYYRSRVKRVPNGC
jgi:hypothetical protein